MLPAGTMIDGKPLLFADDLDFVDDDTIVFSDASTKYDYYQFVHDFVENQPNGRLFYITKS